MLTTSTVQAIRTHLSSHGSLYLASASALKDARRVAREALGIKRLSPEQAAACDELVNKVIERRQRRGCDPLVLARNTRPARAWARTVEAFKSALSQCSYREPSGRWAGGEVRVYVQHAGLTTAEVGVHTETAATRSRNGKWSGNDLIIRCAIPHDWRRSVEARGVAVVEGRLVLGVLWSMSAVSGPSRAHRVVAVKQSRGLRLTTEIAFVVCRPGRPPYFATESSAWRDVDASAIAHASLPTDLKHRLDLDPGDENLIRAAVRLGV